MYACRLGAAFLAFIVALCLHSAFSGSDCLADNSPGTMSRPASLGQATFSVNMFAPAPGPGPMQYGGEDWVIAAISQGSKDTLRCPRGATFSKVDFAGWGLYHLSGSGQFNTDTLKNCQKDVTNLVQQSCVGREQCTLEPDVAQFGNICPELKSLAVRMVCSPNQTSKDVIKMTIPENQKSALSCKSGEVMVGIDFASYGRQLVTASGFQIDPMFSCNSEKTMGIVQERCLGRNSCDLTASNKYFGDPCVNVVKSLAVQARCSSTANMPKKNMIYIINENSEQTLKCPNGRFGQVIWAGYGKQFRDATGFKVDPQFKCNSDKPHAIVQDRCQGRSQCDIEASNKHYGDPCKKVLKTLAIEIECISY